MVSRHDKDKKINLRTSTSTRQDILYNQSQKLYSIGKTRVLSGSQISYTRKSHRSLSEYKYHNSKGYVEETSFITQPVQI